MVGDYDLLSQNLIKNGCGHMEISRAERKKQDKSGSDLTKK